MPWRFPTRPPSSQQCLWITDHVPTEAYSRFLRVSNAHNKCHFEGRRHGSNVPGPLEARRRLARRRMGVMTVTPGLPLGNAECGALFSGNYGGFDPQRDLKWKPPGYEKVKKDEHWLFPKKEQLKEKEAWELLFDIKEPQRDPVEQSKAAFDKIFAKIMNRRKVELEHLDDILSFLQGAENETAAHHSLRLAVWLTCKQPRRRISRPAAQAVGRLLLDKVRLGTIDTSELSSVLATTVQSDKWTNTIVTILDHIAAGDSLRKMCVSVTKKILEPTGTIPPIRYCRQWLNCLLSCQHLRTARHSRNYIWDAIYPILASKFPLPYKFDEHFASITTAEMCRVLIRHWSPLVAFHPERDRGDLSLGVPSRRINRSDMMRHFNAPERHCAFTRLLSVLATHGLPYRKIAHSLYTILLRKPKTLHRFIIHMIEESRRPNDLTWPGGVMNRYMVYLVSTEDLGQAASIFRMVPSLPLSVCYPVVLALAHHEKTSSEVLWRFLDRVIGPDMVPQSQRTHLKNSLTRRHTEVVHLVARTYADATHISHKVAYRRVWECYRFLRDRNAPITSLLSRAMVTAGILRPLQARVRPPTKQVEYILSIVAKIEGREVATRLDEVAWALWQTKVLPEIVQQGRLKRQNYSLSDDATILKDRPWRQKYLSDARAMKLANRLDADGWPKKLSVVVAGKDEYQAALEEANTSFGLGPVKPAGPSPFLMSDPFAAKIKTSSWELEGEYAPRYLTSDVATNGDDPTLFKPLAGSAAGPDGSN